MDNSRLYCLKFLQVLSGLLGAYLLYWIGFLIFGWLGVVGGDGWSILGAFTVLTALVPVILLIESVIWLLQRKNSENKRTARFYVIGGVSMVVLLVFNVREILVPLNEMFLVPMGQIIGNIFF